MNWVSEALSEGRPVLIDHMDGGMMSWKSPDYNHMHPVDPLLFELGWRARDYLVDEGVMGRPDLTGLRPSYRQPWVFYPD